MPRRIISSKLDHRFAALLQRPHPVRDGFNPTPVTIRMEPFGQLDSSKSWFKYTQLPGAETTRYKRTGTGPGGVAFLPPELDIRYVSRDLSAMRGSLSDTYIVAAGCNWAAGIPDLEVNGVRSGYSWLANNGSLEFWQHNAMGARTVAVRFGASHNFSWTSGTTFWGTFLHYNTADRNYRFPDASGTVMLTSDPDGIFDPDRVLVTDAAGLANTDNSIRWIASASTLEIGIASGVSSGVTGTHRFFHKDSPMFGDLYSKDLTANRTWELPDESGTLALNTQLVDTPRWTGIGKIVTATALDGAWIAQRSGTITSIALHRRLAGNAGSTTVDVNLNGVTVFTTQANRPSVAFGAGNDAVDIVTNMDVTSFVAGDRITVDVDAVESGIIVPRDLSLIVEVRYG